MVSICTYSMIDLWANDDENRHRSPDFVLWQVLQLESSPRWNTNEEVEQKRHTSMKWHFSSSCLLWLSQCYQLFSFIPLTSHSFSQRPVVHGYMSHPGTSRPLLSLTKPSPDSDSSPWGLSTSKYKIILIALENHQPVVQTKISRIRFGPLWLEGVKWVLSLKSFLRWPARDPGSCSWQWDNSNGYWWLGPELMIIVGTIILYSQYIRTIMVSISSLWCWNLKLTMIIVDTAPLHAIIPCQFQLWIWFWLLRWHRYALKWKTHDARRCLHRHSHSSVVLGSS